MSFRTIHNNRLIDGEKLDKLSLTYPINLDEVPREAPKDNKEYARKNGAWTEVTWGGGGSVNSVTGTMVDNTDPANPVILSDSTKQDVLGYTAADDANVVHNTGDETIAGIKTFTSDVVITDGDGALDVRDTILHLTGTGVISGGALSISGTDILVALGTGERVDVSVFPHVFKTVTWTSQTVANTFLSSAFTYVYVNDDGSIHLTNVDPTIQSVTEKILLGVVANIGGSQAAAAPRKFVLKSLGAQFQEMMRNMGAINVKGAIRASANGANLNLNFSAGSIWRVGANSDVSIEYPNTKAVTAKTAPTLNFYYTNPSGAIVSAGASASFNVTQYNNAGVLTTIPTNKYANARITMSPNGNSLILLPDRVYNSLADAIAGRATEDTVIPPLISDQAVVAWITYKEGVTALNNTTLVSILNVASFSGGAGGGGAGGGDMSTLIYDPAGIAQQVVGTTAPQALTNKTIALGSNTVSGTLAQFNAAITDADITPTSRTLTINGTAYDLSADRSWTVSGGKADLMDIASSGTVTLGTVATSIPTGAGTLNALTISVKSLPTGANLLVDLKKNGTSVLSTTLSITTTEAATNGYYTVTTGDSGKATISTTAFAAKDVMTLVVTQVGSTLPGYDLSAKLTSTYS